MKLLITCFVLITTIAFGQDAQKEINDQVWKPFIQHFNDHATESFMAVHSKDVVRAARDGQSIWNWSDYREVQRKGDEREKELRLKRALVLRFTERIAQKDLAIEVGIYKTSVTDTQGKTQDYYGRFHVVLRKENDVWKILVDTDSSEGNTIGEKEFLAAKPLE